MMSRINIKYLLIGMVLALGAVIVPCSAEQIQIIDWTYIHSSWHHHVPASDFVTKPSSAQKTWDAYFRVECIEYTGKPDQFMTQPCFFWDKKSSQTHTCVTRKSSRWNFTKPAVKYLVYPLPEWWMYKGCNWDNIIDFMSINNYPNDTKHSTPSKPRVRIELFFVKPGTKLQAPAHWKEPSDWTKCKAGCWESDVPTRSAYRPSMGNNKSSEFRFDISRHGRTMAVRSESGQRLFSVSIMDISGRKIQGVFNSNESVFVAERSVVPGLYLVTAVSDNGSRTAKVCLVK